MIFHSHFKIIVVVVSFEHMIRLVGCYSPCTEPGKNTTCFSKGDFQSDQKKKKKRNNSKKLGKKERENLLLAG